MADTTDTLTLYINYNEEDNSEDYFENAVYEDSVNFSSMADYEDFLIWGTDNKDQFI